MLDFSLSGILMVVDAAMMRLRGLGTKVTPGTRIVNARTRAGASVSDCQ
jgi:hypothetical protein